MSSSPTTSKEKSTTSTSPSKKRCIELVTSSNSIIYSFKMHILIKYFIFSAETEAKDTGKRTKKSNISNKSTNDNDDE
jgi:hypothetical protein